MSLSSTTSLHLANVIRLTELEESLQIVLSFRHDRRFIGAAYHTDPFTTYSVAQLHRCHLLYNLIHQNIKQEWAQAVSLSDSSSIFEVACPLTLTLVAFLVLKLWINFII